jgi:hypothetical protein
MKIFIAKDVFGNKLFADRADPKFHGFHSSHSIYKNADGAIKYE